MDKQNRALRAASSGGGEGGMRALWGRMGAIYGHRWGSSYSEDWQGPEARTWAVVLADLTPQQLADGLHALTKSADGWPPSLPEFRARCLGVPEFAHVLPMLRPGAPELSPFAKLVLSHVDAYALRNADARAERAMLREAYDCAARFILDGGELPTEAPRIEHDPTVERMLYDALHMKRMRELLANGETKAGDDACPA